MNITQNSYTPGYFLSPRYIRVEKDAGTSIIIIDDVMNTGSVEVHTEVNRDVSWVQVTPGFSVVVLDTAPSGSLTAFSPVHENLDRTRIFVQDTETFIVKYTGLTKTTQEQVVGYSIGSGDTLYLKIDRTSDTVTVYHP